MSREKAARIIKSPCVLRPGGASRSVAHVDVGLTAGTWGMERCDSTAASDGQPPAKTQREVPGAHVMSCEAAISRLLSIYTAVLPRMERID